MGLVGCRSDGGSYNDGRWRELMVDRLRSRWWGRWGVGGGLVGD